MEDRVTIEGLDDVLRRYSQLPNLIIHELVAAMERGAKRVVKLMQRLAPVDSGELRASIGWTWGKAPKGSMAVGTVATPGLSVAITIYAGGTPGTLRKQRRASGSRKSDQAREGHFDADNARYQEFGTSKMPAQPYFYPAWRSERKSFKASQTAAIRKACKQLFTES